MQHLLLKKSDKKPVIFQLPLVLSMLATFNNFIITTDGTTTTQMLRTVNGSINKNVQNYFRFSFQKIGNH